MNIQNITDEIVIMTSFLFPDFCLKVHPPSQIIWNHARSDVLERSIIRQEVRYLIIAFFSVISRADCADRGFCLIVETRSRLRFNNGLSVS